MMITQEIAPETTISEELEEIVFPPSDLYSDEPPLETELHFRQLILLLQCLEWLWKDRTDFYAAGNLSIYYTYPVKTSQEYRGPDFFVVLGTEKKIRKSWVVWDEDGQYPHVIVEILSPITEETDKVFKKELYEDTFRVLDYFWFDPYTLEFAGFHLISGKYQLIEPNEKGHLWSEQLGLYLGIYQGLLRYFTPQGELVPTPEESAEMEAQKAERLAAKLRELNIDPDTI